LRGAVGASESRPVCRRAGSSFGGNFRSLHVPLEIDGERFPGAVRDTILVTPDGEWSWRSTPTIPDGGRFTATLLYHLDAGMFTTIKYA
jgi:hypothetical protein